MKDRCLFCLISVLRTGLSYPSRQVLSGPSPQSSRRRSRLRALCNCDLEQPVEQPKSLAISLCSYPITSYIKKICLQPDGNLLTARLRLNRSIASSSEVSPERSTSGFSSFELYLFLSSPRFSVDFFVRRCINTMFTVTRCSQVENLDSPRKVPIFRKRWMKVCCVKSSASAVFLTMRRSAIWAIRTHLHFTK